MTDRVKVVVVGGGIVGCSVLYWLAKLGWNELLLLEKNELTSGSTWHAAGNVTFFGHDARITRLYVDSAKTYLEAEREADYPVGCHETGSLRLALNDADIRAYRRLQPMYQELAIPYHILDVAEIQNHHPLLNPSGIVGAALTPTDGHVDPTAATHAMAQCARKRGAQISCRSEVNYLAQEGNRWRIVLDSGDILADHVVMAASFWSRELLQPLDIQLPLYPLEHHEVITESVPAITRLDFRLPVVRDPWSQSNTRQEGKGFLCGVYEPKPVFWGLEGIPEHFNQELLVPDLDRLEHNLALVIERFPDFANAGIRAINNGPICYTPDACPLLGPVNSHPGLWLASGFAIGIGTGGGSGEFLARWMDGGSPPFELPMVYPDRFDGWSREATLDAIQRTYAAGYVRP